MIEKINKFREYLDYVEEHYNNVQTAWKLINDKCQNQDFRFIDDDFIWNSIDAEVKQHDMSKLSAEEFTQYRRHFFPCASESKDARAFKNAWEHHKQHNEHHWQTWTDRHAQNPHSDMFLIMNIVDWVAMGIKFNDTAKDYYEKHKDVIKLPEWAVKLMYQVFDCIYK